MNENQLKMLEVLEDTKLFFEVDVQRRVIDEEGNCSYEDAQGNRCAVGRQLTEKDIEILRKMNLLTNVSVIGIKPHLETSKIIFQFPTDFWEDIQTFHDTEHYWNPDQGLSKEGHRKYAEIKNNIKSGHYWD